MSPLDTCVELETVTVDDFYQLPKELRADKLYRYSDFTVFGPIPAAENGSKHVHTYREAIQAIREYHAQVGHLSPTKAHASEIDIRSFLLTLKPGEMGEFGLIRVRREAVREQIEQCLEPQAEAA